MELEKEQLPTNLNKNKIILTLLNGTGYIFEVDDYMRLRSEHHMVGTLVGSCANKGWSAQHCTMPVELTQWETRLLLEENLAILTAKQKHLLAPADSADLALYKEQFEQRLDQQANALAKEKFDRSAKNLDKIMVGKKKKLLQQGIPESEINLNAAELLSEIRQGLVFNRNNALIDIPCAHSESHGGFVCEFSTPDRSLKYAVFRDLWRRGKYVTCGDAFGADFLIYPGDPLQYHASHLVILLENARISALSLVAKVRLAVTVNKICLMAFFDSDSEDDDEDEDDNEIASQSGSNEALQEPKRKRVKKTATNSSLSPKIAYEAIQWDGDKDKERRQEAKAKKKFKKL